MVRLSDEESVIAALGAAVEHPHFTKLPKRDRLGYLNRCLREHFAERDDVSKGFVGVAQAATILGVPKPRIYKLVEQGRMPEPWGEFGNGPLYWRAEVEELARQLRRERREREAARELAGAKEET